MKIFKITVLFLLLIPNSEVQAQDNCTGYDELNRKRHQIAGGQYGHPYTIFDRKNGLSFDETLNRVIDNKCMMFY